MKSILNAMVLGLTLAMSISAGGTTVAPVPNEQRTLICNSVYTSADGKVVPFGVHAKVSGDLLLTEANVFTSVESVPAYFAKNENLKGTVIGKNKHVFEVGQGWSFFALEIPVSLTTYRDSHRDAGGIFDLNLVAIDSHENTSKVLGKIPCTVYPTE